MKGISVIIPTYNREKFIGQAIQSVLEQEYESPIEVIICDDGSSDNTIKIAESFGDKITILRKPKNCLTQGAASTRNRGIRASTQSYICFLDSDDFFLPGHLKKISSALESKPKLGFAFCRTLECKKEINSKLFKPWTRLKITNRDIRNPAVSRNNVVHTNTFLFQRYVFDIVGVFNENYTNGEDSDMWMRISEIYSGTFADYYGVVRREHASGQLIDNNEKQILKCHYYAYKNAKKRFYNLEKKEYFRLFRLQFYILKYRIFYSKPFIYIYKFYIHYKKNKNIKSNEWNELAHFL
jgi:glycosyltransferase involved in cell wall biosynthesis